MILVAQQDPAIAQRLTDELSQVETRFATELSSDLACVNSLITHVERYRGKMLRPMLVLVSGMAASPSGKDVNERHRVIAAVVEMVHMATLVHDDVLDEALVRRRGSTINHLRGNETAVMLGDYLISHAYHLCSGLDEPRISRLIADSTNVVCEGELLQLANRHNWSLDEPTYFEIIRRKTASLCGTCCRLGGVLHGSEPAVGEALYEFGEKVGTAFQIVDDLLDVTGSESTVGKTLGRDLAKGKLTLPMIHHLAASSPAQRERFMALLPDSPPPAEGGSDDASRGSALHEALVATGSIAYATAAAGRLIDRAHQSLGHLPATASRQLLHDMADAVLTRRF